MEKGGILILNANYKGGINNLQIARVFVGSPLVGLKTFTSTKCKAKQYAERWAKKNNIEIA